MVNAKAVKGAAKSAKETVENRGTRRARTLSLDDGLYARIQRHCAGEGLTVSEVVDALLEGYLALVEPKQ